MRVLVADENRLILEGFRRALEHVADIEIVGAAHCGGDVMQMVERRCPDLVAVDVAMRPVVGGRTCLELILDEHPAVKVVVMSSSSDSNTVHWALSRGARAVIVKSVNPLDIPSALRQAWDETVFHAFGFREAPEDALREAGLTDREVTMLKALGRGLSNKAICRELWLAEPTVKFHLGNLYRKLGVPNRLAAANFAHQHGLSPSGPAAV